MKWRSGQGGVRWVRAGAGVSERPEAALEPLSTRLIRLRLERRLTQRGMALRLGRDHAIVSRWESGDRTPTLVDMATIARVLRMDLDTLLQGVRVDGPTRQRSSRAHGARQRSMIGRALRVARMLRRMRPPVVTQHTGIEPRRLLAIEAGVDAGLDEVLALTRLYGLKPSELLLPQGLDTGKKVPMVPESMGTSTDPNLARLRGRQPGS